MASPIIFSAPMVRAILAGKKTQTRRPITRGRSLFDGRRPDPADWAGLRFGDAFVDRGPSPAGNPGPYLRVRGEWAHGEDTQHRVYPRAHIGEQLWVKERWRTVEQCDSGQDGVVYSDDHTFIPIANMEESSADAWVAAHRSPRARSGGWRSPIFMPRWASRITLEVVEVRVQRLTSISEEDVRAEGFELPELNWAAPYERAWESLHGHGSWGADPWVWVITFKRLP